jgi:hypothetical protein
MLEIARERHFLLDVEILLKTENRPIKEGMGNLKFGSPDVEIF